MCHRSTGGREIARNSSQRGYRNKKAQAKADSRMRKKRKARFTLFAYVATKEADAVMATMAGLLNGLPPELLKTLTFDNGKEFALFKTLRKEFGLDVYFARPYHSWERGTNENRNGIVRKVLPKGTDFDHITPEQMARIDRMLNDRPMMCLGWRTPREVFMARLAYCLKAA